MKKSRHPAALRFPKVIPRTWTGPFPNVPPQHKAHSYSPRNPRPEEGGTFYTSCRNDRGGGSGKMRSGRRLDSTSSRPPAFLRRTAAPFPACPPSLSQRQRTVFYQAIAHQYKKSSSPESGLKIPLGFMSAPGS